MDSSARRKIGIIRHRYQQTANPSAVQRQHKTGRLNNNTTEDSFFPWAGVVPNLIVPYKVTDHGMPPTFFAIAAAIRQILLPVIKVGNIVPIS